MPRPPTQSGPLRRAFHLVVALAGWAIFSWWWWLVLRRVGRDEVRYTVLFIAWTLVVCVGLTGLWAYHNLRLYRRRGPRTRVREAIESFTHDHLGRSIDFAVPIDGLKHERQIWIEIDRDQKRYHNGAGDGPSRDGETLRARVPINGPMETEPVRRPGGVDVGR